MPEENKPVELESEPAEPTEEAAPAATTKAGGRHKVGIALDLEP
ncbi:hypothetical protein ACIGBH_39545 [Streptomyces sp. NPDC085929]